MRCGAVRCVVCSCVVRGSGIETHPHRPLTNTALPSPLLPSPFSLLPSFALLPPHRSARTLDDTTLYPATLETNARNRQWTRWVLTLILILTMDEVGSDTDTDTDTK